MNISIDMRGIVAVMIAMVAMVLPAHACAASCCGCDDLADREPPHGRV